MAMIGTICLAMCVACTGPEDRIKPGASEAEVVRILGQASRTTYDQVDLDVFRTIRDQISVIDAPATAAVPRPAAGDPAPASQDRHRVTLMDAGKVFGMKRQGEGLAPSTISKYSTFIKQLTAFADRWGYVFVDQLNVDALG